MFLRFSPISASRGVHKGLAGQISYLEKENLGKPPQEQEHFFNQYQEKIPSQKVLMDLANIKMQTYYKHGRPLFYNLIISPSQHELAHIQNQTGLFKQYVKEVMKHYAAAFHRERAGRPISVNDIKYYAKIEHNRYFTSKDPQVRENTPYLKRMDVLRKEIREMENTNGQASLQPLKKELEHLQATIPHKLGDQPIKAGLQKPGFQTHAHVILSRRDASNSIGLSPGNAQKAHKTFWNGRWITKGFDQDGLKQRAEESFDKMFAYPRNYVETYSAMKTFKRDPQQYYRELQALPPKEKERAFQLLEKPSLNLTSQMTQQALKHLQKAIKAYNRSASIEY